MITRIRIPSKWRLPTAGEQYGVADFQLGLGSCGLIVTYLQCDYNVHGDFLVYQECSNNETKTFHYRREDITGRIEITENKS